MKRKFHQGAPVVGERPSCRQTSGNLAAGRSDRYNVPAWTRILLGMVSFFFTCRFSPCSFVDRSNRRSRELRAHRFFRRGQVGGETLVKGTLSKYPCLVQNTRAECFSRLTSNF